MGSIRPCDCECWNTHEPLRLGEARSHYPRDAYRDALEGDHDRQAAVLADAPIGSLATSHYRRRGAGRVVSRYDHVLASLEVTILNVEYRWEEAVAAGSDHALIFDTHSADASEERLPDG